MKYLDLFSGYGGFELGIQQAYDNNAIRPIQQVLQRPSDSGNTESWRRHSEPHCIGFSEIDKYAIQVYKKHFNHKNYGDIKSINPAELPDFDLLCGGFPCQAFSIAGKRAGFEDTRGTLIYDVFRIIKEKHPKLVLLENVKGLLSHDNGRTFKTIITSLAELGYAVEWQVLNAKNFGVPQNRERVFIVGHLGGFGGRQIFPIGGEPTKNTGKVAATIMARDYKGIGNQEMTILRGRPRYENGKRNLKWYEYKDCPTVSTNVAQGDQKNLVVPTIRATEYKHGDNQTLIAKNRMKIRRLTPTECERLMGLPDGWTEGVSDTQRYKLCGNGVVVNVVKEIIKKLI